MLTADLVRTRRKGRDLYLVPLGALRPRAVELATLYVDLAAEHVGRTRDQLTQAWAEVPTDHAERLVAAGLRKLIDDRCTFESSGAIDPETLRRDLFLAAAAARREGRFDRPALLAEAAARHGVAAPEVERLLFGDLLGAHRLVELPPTDPTWLVDHYELAQAQAVLLRAVQVTVDVHCASPATARALFRKLKFLRLLHTIHPTTDGHRITIDGPYALFEAVTRYGLQLALALPAIREAGAFRLEADLRWGKARQPLRFTLRGEGQATSDGAALLPEEAARLLEQLKGESGAWRVAPARTVLPLPGLGLCVPDLVFTRAGQRIYLEVLGFWSREAVWRRVELVEGGLEERILFAVSERLRVSEAALPPELPGALYVYKGALSPRTVLAKIEALAAR